MYRQTKMGVFPRRLGQRPMVCEATGRGVTLGRRARGPIVARPSAPSSPGLPRASPVSRSSSCAAVLRVGPTALSPRSAGRGEGEKTMGVPLWACGLGAAGCTRRPRAAGWGARGPGEGANGCTSRSVDREAAFYWHHLEVNRPAQLPPVEGTSGGGCSSRTLTNMWKPRHFCCAVQGPECGRATPLEADEWSILLSSKELDAKGRLAERFSWRQGGAAEQFPDAQGAAGGRREQKESTGS